MTDPSDPPPPRANPELLGQATAEAALLESWRSGRLPHGWMLTGPPGIGKATLAFRFARFVLAQNGQGAAQAVDLAIPTAAPAFRRVAAGGHADLLTVERGEAREIGVEAIRRIDPFLRLTAAEGAWRIAVIDDADTMNRNAANALLKILEEPPSRTLLLLVCANPGLLPPTLRSRCRVLPLVPLGEADLAALLGRYHPALDSQSARAIASMAEGSIGRALALAGTDGLEGLHALLTLFGAGPPPRPAGLLALAEAAGRDAASFGRSAELLSWWMERQARHLAAGAPPTPLSPQDAAASARVSALFPGRPGLDRWLSLWDNTRRLLAQADHANLDRKQVLLQAFLEIGRACDA